MAQYCKEHSVPVLLVDGKWDCPFCVADLCSDIDAELNQS